MALPTFYTEETLKEYMHSLLNAAGYADALEWSVEAGSYDEIVNDVLLALGVTDITTLTGTQNIKRVRVAARYYLWRGVSTFIASSYGGGSTRVGNASIDLGGDSIIRGIASELAAAEVDAMALGLVEGYKVGRFTIRHRNDPYRTMVCEDEVAGEYSDI